MDPYLEGPELWSGVHGALCFGLARRLQGALAPRYVVRAETRVYVQTEGESGTGRRTPDVWVARSDDGGAPAPTEAAEPAEPLVVTLPMPATTQERFVVIRRPRERRVVTTIELLSPTNKSPRGRGREVYLAKREETLASRTHLVEVDLLREGERPPIEGAVGSAYYVLVSRADERPQARLHPVSLRTRLPRVSVPLEAAEEVELDLQAVLDEVYDAYRYELDLDYSAPPTPPLGSDDWAWAQELLHAPDEPGP